MRLVEEIFFIPDGFTPFHNIVIIGGFQGVCVVLPSGPQSHFDLPRCERSGGKRTLFSGSECVDFDPPRCGCTYLSFQLHDPQDVAHQLLGFHANNRESIRGEISHMSHIFILFKAESTQVTAPTLKTDALHTPLGSVVGRMQSDKKKQDVPLHPVAVCNMFSFLSGYSDPQQIYEHAIQSSRSKSGSSQLNASDTQRSVLRQSSRDWDTAVEGGFFQL